jgi:hypothetical protein
MSMLAMLWITTCAAKLAPLQAQIKAYLLAGASWQPSTWKHGMILPASSASE